MAQEQLLASTMSEQKQIYRPIAPSIAVAGLPRADIFETDKRKLSSSFDDSAHSVIKHQRRGSGSSQGSNSSIEQRRRRKEQNRTAQRAFRERKERYVKELEDKIKDIKAAHATQVAQLEKENTELKNGMEELQDEIRQLKGSSKSTANVDFDMSSNEVHSCVTNDTSVTQKVSSSHPYPNSKSNASSPSTPLSISTPRVPSSAVACIRDKDGVSFCERLKEEVCSNAYNRLLAEPLFDSQGLLNETIANDPVPIVTDERKAKRSKIDVFNELEQSLFEIFSPVSANTHDGSDDFVSCSIVWNRLAQHPMFDQFDLDVLCDELRKRAKCSKAGPVFEDYEVNEVMDMMENQVHKQQKQKNSNSPTTVLTT